MAIKKPNVGDTIVVPNYFGDKEVVVVGCPNKYRGTAWEEYVWVVCFGSSGPPHVVFSYYEITLECPRIIGSNNGNGNMDETRPQVGDTIVLLDTKYYDGEYKVVERPDAINIDRIPNDAVWFWSPTDRTELWVVAERAKIVKRSTDQVTLGVSAKTEITPAESEQILRDKRDEIFRSML